MKIIKNLFFLLLLLSFIPVAQACDEPVMTIESCIGKTQWNFSNSEGIKNICGGVEIDLDVRCSPGSVLNGNDQICIYEILGGGIEVLVYCGLYSNFSFTPVVGKTYRLEVNQPNNSGLYQVVFNSVDCLDFEMTQGNFTWTSDCVPADRAIDFKLISSDIRTDYCYLFEWDFGDGSPILSTSLSDEATHTYDYVGPSNCRNYTVTIRAVPSDLCEGCTEEYVFSKTIRVCRFCESAPGEPGPVGVSFAPNPTQGPGNVWIEYSGNHKLQRLIITRLADGAPMFEEQLPADISFPYAHYVDLSAYPAGSYSVTVISSGGESGSAQIFKE